MALASSTVSGLRLAFRPMRWASPADQIPDPQFGDEPRYPHQTGFFYSGTARDEAAPHDEQAHTPAQTADRRGRQGSERCPAVKTVTTF